MKSNNFYILWAKFLIVMYFVFLLKYVFFIIRSYLEEKVLFWNWIFLVDNLKTTLVVCIPCFILHWILYKFGSKKYRE